ncbi:MAG: archaeosortase/exosortase family protein [Myxococcales bacterium]|nr:archaeosortase/exosortase family protein [Myxococcales bacterium]
MLAAIAGLILFVNWGLLDFNPEPYGTAPIDGAEAELFAPAGGTPVLIFAVVALLLISRRAQLQRALRQPPLWVAGACLLACGGVIGRWADFVRAPELLIPSMILLLLGAGAMLGGRSGLRAIAAPALFLVFAFPIPASIVNWIVWPLQLSTASSTEAFMRLIGHAPERFGDVIYTGPQWFQVIETCSGMRMIETLIMASVLYSILFYRRPFQVISLLLVAPIFGYFVNFVRVLSIIFNPYGTWSPLHTAQGIVMLGGGVLLIVAFDNLLKRLEAKLPSSAKNKLHQTDMTDARLTWARPVSVALFLLILGTGNFLIPAWQPEASTALSHEPRALRLPPELAGSMPKGRKLDRKFLGSVGVTKWLHREYDFLDSSVQIQILTDDRLNGRGSLISKKTAVPGLGYSELSHDVVPLSGGGYVDRFLYRSQSQQSLVYHWYEGTAGNLEEIWRNTLVLDRGPARRDHWAVSMRLSTVVSPGTEGMAGAEARLQGFAEVIRNALR